MSQTHHRWVRLSRIVSLGLGLGLSLLFFFVLQFCFYCLYTTTSLFGVAISSGTMT